MLDLIGDARMTGAIWSLARQFLRAAETELADLITLTGNDHLRALLGEGDGGGDFCL